jgi:hypothetical protein
MNCERELASMSLYYSVALSEYQRAYLLLLHELRVRAVVDDILAEDGRGEHRVDVLGAHIADLAVEDEVVALGPDIDGGLLAEQDEGKAVAVLCKAVQSATSIVLRVSVCPINLTFFLFSLKKRGGSIP